MTTVRSANYTDAHQLARFIEKLDAESDFLLYGAGERQCTLSVTQQYLQRIASNEKSLVLIALDGLEIVGFICGEVSSIKRIAHVMKVNIGIVRDQRGKGISNELGRVMEEHLIAKKIKRVEATIITENILSMNLAKKFGLTVEGIRRASIMIGDKYYDEFLLSKVYE